MMDKYGRRIKRNYDEGRYFKQSGLWNDQKTIVTALWLALQTGFRKLKLCLPYTFYDKKLGLEGTVSTNNKA